MNTFFLVLSILFHDNNNKTHKFIKNRVTHLHLLYQVTPTFIIIRYKSIISYKKNRVKYVPSEVTVECKGFKEEGFEKQN